MSDQYKDMLARFVRKTNKVTATWRHQHSTSAIKDKDMAQLYELQLEAECLLKQGDMNEAASDNWACGGYSGTCGNPNRNSSSCG